MQYIASTYAKGVYDIYWFEKNLHGDILYMPNNGKNNHGLSLSAAVGTPGIEAHWMRGDTVVCDYSFIRDNIVSIFK